MYYLITWHESDGNNCTVYDTIVSAESEDKALDMLSDAMEKQMERNGQSYDSDGNQLGYYFPCDESCGEECEGHGGTSLRTVEAFNTEGVALDACSKWHSRWDI